MSKKDKRSQYDYSYEANCLSVSVVPHSWKQILKLETNTATEPTKENGTFLDVLEFRKSSLFQETIDWAVAKELIEIKEAYKTWTFDDEMNEWMFTYFDTIEEAIEEVDTYEEYDGDISLFPYPEGEDIAIKLTKTHIAKDALFDLLEHKKTNLINVDDFIVIAYAQEVLDVDGLWWNYTNAPDKHIAPCGGIIPNKIAEWKVEKVNIYDINDEKCLLNFAKENLKDNNVKPYY